MQSSLPNLDYGILTEKLMENDSMKRQASIENEIDENKKDLKKVAMSLVTKGHLEEGQKLEAIIDQM